MLIAEVTVTDQHQHNNKKEKIMKTIILKTLVIFPAVMIALPAMAQGAPPATPIDGGLSLLLAAGGVYGIKKLRDSRK